MCPIITTVTRTPIKSIMSPNTRATTVKVRDTLPRYLPCLIFPFLEVKCDCVRDCSDKFKIIRQYKRIIIMIKYPDLSSITYQARQESGWDCTTKSEWTKNPTKYCDKNRQHQIAVWSNNICVDSLRLKGLGCERR